MGSRSRTRLKQLSMHVCIGAGNGIPLHCSCLENPRGGGAWWAAMGSHRVRHDWSDSSSSNLAKLELILLERFSLHRWINKGYKRRCVQDSKDRSKLATLFLSQPEGHSRAQSTSAAHTPCHCRPTHCRRRRQPAPLRAPSAVSVTPGVGTFYLYVKGCQLLLQGTSSLKLGSWR